MYGLRKNITALVLLAVMSAPLLISVYQLVQQQYIQHQVKERLETAALETYTIPANELHWIKKDREILLNGHFFDVKSITKAGNSYIVKGLFDHKETAIAKKIEQQAGDHNKNTGYTKTALQFLLLTVFCKNHYDITISSAVSTAKAAFARYNQPVCTRPISVSTPPPDRV
jgi:hypothetical protein